MICTATHAPPYEQWLSPFPVAKAKVCLAVAALLFTFSGCGSSSDDEANIEQDEGEADGSNDQDSSDDESDLSDEADDGEEPGPRDPDGDDASNGGSSRDAGARRDGGPSSNDGRRDGSTQPDTQVDDAQASPDSNDQGSEVDAAAGNEGSACGGGRTWPASDDSGAIARVGRYAQVHFNLPTSTQFLALETTLTVPAKPRTSSTLYAWPGLEPWPGGDNFDPVGQGVLQPVLTWGTSCGDYAPKRPTGWWISPQYVNPFTSERAFYGCHGGKAIDVAIGTDLDIRMWLEGTVWRQVVVDRQTGQMTNFDMDLRGQAQNWALFEIEFATQNRPVSDVVFTSTTLTFADPEPTACQPSVRGPDDYFAPPQSSQDGTKCCVSRIVVRAQGVPATTPNAP